MYSQYQCTHTSIHTISEGVYKDTLHTRNTNMMGTRNTFSFLYLGGHEECEKYNKEHVGVILMNTMLRC